MGLFGRKEFRCSNCKALITESTFRKHDGECGFCASASQDRRDRQQKVGIARSRIKNPKCAKCGASEKQRVEWALEKEKSGEFVYLADWPALLYCDDCQKFFCGRCQLDLGMTAGCPQCRKDLEIA